MPVKGSVESIIEIAKKELGTIEGPKDNETKYGAWIKVNFQPWCQSFVSWCAMSAGPMQDGLNLMAAFTA